jgi:hypothetical protein
MVGKKETKRRNNSPKEERNVSFAVLMALIMKSTVF